MRRGTHDRSAKLDPSFSYPSSFDLSVVVSRLAYLGQLPYDGNPVTPGSHPWSFIGLYRHSVTETKGGIIQIDSSFALDSLQCGLLASIQ
jgi:hypothetical protein